MSLPYTIQKIRQNHDNDHYHTLEAHLYQDHMGNITEQVGCPQEYSGHPETILVTYHVQDLKPGSSIYS